MPYTSRVKQLFDGGHTCLPVKGAARAPSYCKLQWQSLGGQLGVAGGASWIHVSCVSLTVMQKELAFAPKIGKPGFKILVSDCPCTNRLYGAKVFHIPGAGNVI